MQVPDGALNYFHFFENKCLLFDAAEYTDIRMKNEMANKIERFTAPKVDGSKFGRPPQEGILEISHFTDRVRLKLSLPQVSGIPVVDEEIAPAIYEEVKDVLTRGCTRISIHVIDEASGQYIREANLNISI